MREEKKKEMIKEKFLLDKEYLYIRSIKMEGKNKLKRK